MMSRQKAERFAELHAKGCFVLPNAWDAGSARILSEMDFKAIATTSAGLAFMLGRRDGRAALSRSDAIANAKDIIAATSLPVSADLEDGYGPVPGDCAETVRLAIEAGLCGCTIEDTTADPTDPIHGFDAAIARIRAAVAAARSAPYPFILTARAENFLHGRPDLDDTLRRLAAFAEAGADCLYAPGLPSMEAIRKVVAAVTPKPVNVLSGPRDGLVPIDVLADAGVRRVSVGGSLARAAYGQILKLGQNLLVGDLKGALGEITPHATIDGMMAAGGN
jgi:2-methylisocitrate lyase-like PEP mutase family enzyme